MIERSIASKRQKDQICRSRIICNRGWNLSREKLALKRKEGGGFRLFKFTSKIRRRKDTISTYFDIHGDRLLPTEFASTKREFVRRVGAATSVKVEERAVRIAQVGRRLKA